MTYYVAVTYIMYAIFYAWHILLLYNLLHNIVYNMLYILDSAINNKLHNIFLIML
jgi:hypothetical protein